MTNKTTQQNETRYFYVGKCFDIGCPRVWASTRAECEKLMNEWQDKQIRFKPLTLWHYPLRYIKDDEYEISWMHKDEEGNLIDTGVQLEYVD